MRHYQDFPELQGQLQFEREHYDATHPNWRQAWTLLTVAENLEEIYDFVSGTAGNDVDDGKMLQHFLVRQGTNALKSVFYLVREHQYNAARGRARYLFETYLIMRRLNRDQQIAAEKYDEIREEARDLSSQDELTPLQAQPDALHDFRREEQEELSDQSRDGDQYSDFWEMLSNRGSHPTSLRGMLNDGRYNSANEHSLLSIGLTFAFGIAAQYIRTFAGTETRWRIQQRADSIFVEVRLALKSLGLPTLFREELFFWNPVIR